MPMLHGVRDIRGLDDVLDDDGGLPIDCIYVRFSEGVPVGIHALEGLDPAGLAGRAELLIDDIGGHDGVDDEVSEAAELVFGLVDAASEVDVHGLHEQSPREVDGVLLGDGLVAVHLGQVGLLLDELRVRHVLVVHVVDEGGEGAREVDERVTGESP